MKKDAELIHLIVVNVVGIGGATGTAKDVNMDDWAKSMEINVASMVQMAKFAIPEMEKNEGQWRGSIVVRSTSSHRMTKNKLITK
jgi:NAD(P)-dependent dehydrogenase (short-subunit alcohol dehydrogenase family)